MAFNGEQKRKELEDILERWPCFFRKNHEAKQILRILGEQALRYPDDPEKARMSSNTILNELESLTRAEDKAKAEVERKCRMPNYRLTKDERELLDRQIKPPPKDAHQVGLRVSRLRELLYREYPKQGKELGDICLSIPVNDPSDRPFYLTFGEWPGQYRPTATPVPQENQSNENLRAFWNQIAYGFGRKQAGGRPKALRVVFSNESLPGQSDNPRGFSAGSGEVVAAWELSRTLSELQISGEIMPSTKALPLVSRPSSVLVFLGSGLNLSLEAILLTNAKLREQQRFVFEWRGSDAVIADQETGETYVNRGDPLPEKQYGLISLLRLDLTDQTILCLSGIGTLGTEAAAHFVFSDSMASDILQHVSPQGQALGPFQMLFETTIHYETPFGVTALAWHYSKPKGQVAKM